MLQLRIEFTYDILKKFPSMSFLKNVGKLPHQPLTSQANHITIAFYVNTFSC